MNKLTAYCIPTYNHSEILSDILPLMLDECSRINMDIYIYDSSSDRKTEELYEKIKSSSEHIYYLRYDHNLKADAKYLAALKGEGLKKEYDYLWISKDRAYFDITTLEYIEELEQEDYDIIYLPVENDWSRLVQKPTGAVYTDKAEFFRDFGAVTTSWETVIFNCKSLLEDMPWPDYEQNTMFGPEFPFNQTFTVFTGLNNLTNCRIYVADRSKVIRSYHKKGTSTWKNRAFDIWAVTWPEFIDSLPGCYNEFKASVKRDGVSIPWLWASCDIIYMYVTENIFTKEKWELIRNRWSDISILPHEWIEMILNGNLKLLASEVYRTLIACLEHQDIETAYMIYNSLSGLKTAMGKNADMLNDLFRIYASEHSIAAGKWNNEYSYFEEGCKTLQDYKDKEDFIVLLINSVKNELNDNEMEQLIMMKRRLGLSDIAISYYIDKLKSHSNNA